MHTGERNREYTSERNREYTGGYIVPFDGRDKQGRTRAVVLCLYETDFVATPDADVYSSTAPGHYVSFRPQATRDGKPFGPVQPTRHFETDGERDLAIAAYLQSAKARARKSAA